MGLALWSFFSRTSQAGEKVLPEEGTEGCLLTAFEDEFEGVSIEVGEVVEQKNLQVMSVHLKYSEKVLRIFHACIWRL